MSRTYRQPPTWEFIDPDHTEEKRQAYFEELLEYYMQDLLELTLWEARRAAWAEAEGAFPRKRYFGPKVSEKDNHGCTYSKPKSFRKTRNRKARHKANQKLRSMVNSGATAEDFEAMAPLPTPYQYQGWYW